MLQIGAIFCVAAAVAIKELPQLFRRRQRKEAVVFLVLLIIGSIVSLLAVTVHKIASPLKVIEFIYGPVNQIFNS